MTSAQSHPAAAQSQPATAQIKSAASKTKSSTVTAATTERRLCIRFSRGVFRRCHCSKQRAGDPSGGFKIRERGLCDVPRGLGFHTSSGNGFPTRCWYRKPVLMDYFHNKRWKH